MLGWSSARTDRIGTATTPASSAVPATRPTTHLLTMAFLLSCASCCKKCASRQAWCTTGAPVGAASRFFPACDLIGFWLPEIENVPDEAEIPGEGRARAADDLLLPLRALSLLHERTAV